MEAYLCGCELIVNENVGATSYGWDFKDYDFIQEQLKSETKLWNIIEKELN
jgi:hypothetical protein